MQDSSESAGESFSNGLYGLKQ